MKTMPDMQAIRDFRTSERVRTNRGWPGIALLGMAAGTLDLLVAIAWWVPLGPTPVQVLQSVAAWVLGREAAMAGGWVTAGLGFALQCYLMSVMVAGYVLLSRRWPRLLQRPLRHGAAYGATMFALQHLLVVPLLSAAPPAAFRPDWMLTCLLAYMLLLGIPAALLARHRQCARPQQGARGG